MALEDIYEISEIKHEEVSDSEKEYFKIKPSFFPEDYIISKESVKEDCNGYVTDELIKQVDIFKRDTTIFNIGVGQGKSSAIYRLAKYYMEQENFIIILASPYKSLVDKDYEFLCRETSTDQVLHYSDINTLEIPENLSQIKAHIITINSLMGNPGSQIIEQSETKRNYLDALHEFVSSQDKKVVLFFDEIHDSVQNFDPLYLFNLRLWRGLVYKVFISSATFTPSSVVAAIHLAYLPTSTRSNKPVVKIIEANRTDHKKQASLILHLVETDSAADQNYFSNVLYKLLNEEVKSDSNIHILTNFRKIAEGLLNGKYPEISELLDPFNPNLVTGKSQQKFIQSELNIGTSFFTGVNIDSEKNTLFIVVGNSTDPSMGDLSSHGAFINGDVALTQTLARVRSGGEIHILLPRAGSEVGNLRSILSDILNREWLPVNRKWSILERDFKERLSQIRDEVESSKKHVIETLQNNLRRPLVMPPDFYTFILRNGDELLTYKYESYGRSIPSLILRYSLNNQFQNAKLSTIRQYKFYRNEIVISKDLKANVENLLKVLPTEFRDGLIKNLRDEEISDVSALKCLHQELESLMNHTAESEGKVSIIKNGRQLYPSQVRSDRIYLRSLLSLLYQLKFDEFKSFEDIGKYLLNNISAAHQVASSNHLAKVYLELYLSLLEILIPKILSDVNYLEGIVSGDRELREMIRVAKELNQKDFFVREAYSFMSKVNKEEYQNIDSLYVLKQMKPLLKTKVKRIKSDGKKITRHEILGWYEGTQKILNIIGFQGFI